MGCDEQIRVNQMNNQVLLCDLEHETIELCIYYKEGHIRITGKVKTYWRDSGCGGSYCWIGPETNGCTLPEDTILQRHINPNRFMEDGTIRDQSHGWVANMK